MKKNTAQNMNTINPHNPSDLREVKNALRYLAEHLEATETLSHRHGNPLPMCHKHAKNALQRVAYLIE